MKIKYIFISILFFHISLFADFKITDLPKDFISTFEKYKKVELSRDIKKMYSYQVPYMKYLHSYKEFEDFIKINREFEDIKINSANFINDEAISLNVNKKFKGKNSGVVNIDEIWYNINGKYFIYFEFNFFLR